jgi:hypothetical protein
MEEDMKKQKIAVAFFLQVAFAGNSFKIFAVHSN